MFNVTRTLSLLTLLISLAVNCWGMDVSGRLEGTVLWSGEVTLISSVEVPPGSYLEIAAGTRVKTTAPEHKLLVRGSLRVLGTSDAPVEFVTDPGWLGIELMETTASSLIQYAHFSQAEAAISSYASAFEVRNSEFINTEFGVRLLRESGPLVENSRFVNCRIAINNEMRSFPTIRGNHFEASRQSAIFASHNSRGLIENNIFVNNKQGVALLQPYPDALQGNTFSGNELAIYCNQTKNTPRIAVNNFVNNQIALANFSFAYPVVSNNHFADNGTAIRNDQYGSPHVEHNQFSNNQIAIYNYRKSNPKVTKNLFESNQLALHCDYSSYPTVKENNFLHNAEGVKLGIYQSADWEKRSGSKQLMLNESAARKSKNPLLAQAPASFNDVVDVSANWWGRETSLLAAAGSDGNLELFYDRNDLAEVVYEGFGPDAYKLDRIVYAPWLDQAVADAGVLEQK